MTILETSHFFFFNDTATTEIYTLSLHDALPISQCAILPVDSNPYSARLCMFRGVGQGFLNDAIEGDLGGAGKPPGKCHLDVDGQIGAFRYSFGQEADRRNPPKIIQNGWP